MGNSRPVKQAKYTITDDRLIGSSEAMQELLDCSAMMLSNYRKEGLLIQPERGKYDIPASIKTYIKSLKNKSGGDDIDFHTEKARLTKMQADKAEMEVLELSGELVRVEAVVQEWQSQLMDMKGKLLSIPSKLATLLADIDTPAEVQDLIDTYIRESLQELSDYAGDRRHQAQPIGSEEGSETSSEADGK